MVIEIVSFPIKNCGSFHSYVSLPEGILQCEAPFYVMFVGLDSPQSLVRYKYHKP